MKKFIRTFLFLLVPFGLVQSGYCMASPDTQIVEEYETSDSFEEDEESDKLQLSPSKRIFSAKKLSFTKLLTKSKSAKSKTHKKINFDFFTEQLIPFVLFFEKSPPTSSNNLKRLFSEFEISYPPPQVI